MDSKNKPKKYYIIRFWFWRFIFFTAHRYEMITSITLNILRVMLVQLGTGNIVPGSSLSDWNFGSTAFTNWSGEVGKVGDHCNYTLWSEHARPILAAMSRYVKVKRDFKPQYEAAKKAGITAAPDAYAYVFEVAKQLYAVRKQQARKIELQMKINAQNINRTTTNPAFVIADHLLKTICDGGELLYCKRYNANTDQGRCECFGLEEGGFLYKMREEMGHCRGERNATCNPDDPVIKTECVSHFVCTNVSVSTCRFYYGDGGQRNEFHCTGDSATGDEIGNQNMFCRRPGHQARHRMDYVSVKDGQAKCAAVSYILLYTLYVTFYHFVII